MKLKGKTVGLYLASTIAVGAIPACWIKTSPNDTCPDPITYNGQSCSLMSGSRPYVRLIRSGESGQVSYKGDGFNWCKYDCGPDGNGGEIYFSDYQGVTPDGAACGSATGPAPSEPAPPPD